MIEVFGIAFSIMGLLPSIASTLSYSIPAGPVGMVWGWFLASGFIFIVGLAMADLGSAMPTSGGLYWFETPHCCSLSCGQMLTPLRWTHFFASPKWRNPLSFLVGYSNTLGLVGGLCSIDYGFSLMLLSVAVIAQDGNWTPKNGGYLCRISRLRPLAWNSGERRSQNHGQNCRPCLWPPISSLSSRR